MALSRVCTTDVVQFYAGGLELQKKKGVDLFEGRQGRGVMGQGVMRGLVKHLGCA